MLLVYVWYVSELERKDYDKIFMKTGGIEEEALVISGSFKERVYIFCASLSYLFLSHFAMFLHLLHLVNFRFLFSRFEWKLVVFHYPFCS